MNIETLRELRTLADQIEEADTELRMLRAEYARLQAQIAEAMVAEGVSNLRVDDRTWYLRTSTYVSKFAGVSTSDVCDALRACGAEDLVHPDYHPQTLKSWIKERAEELGCVLASEAVPEPLRNLVRVYEETKVHSRAV